MLIQNVYRFFLKCRSKLWICIFTSIFFFCSTNNKMCHFCCEAFEYTSKSEHTQSREYQTLSQVFFFTSIRCSYFVANCPICVRWYCLFRDMYACIYSMQDGKKVIRFQYGALRHTAIVLSMDVCLCWA